jgi:hypothetical protein
MEKEYNNKTLYARWESLHQPCLSNIFKYQAVWRINSLEKRKCVKGIPSNRN